MKKKITGSHLFYVAAGDILHGNTPGYYPPSESKYKKTFDRDIVNNFMNGALGKLQMFAVTGNPGNDGAYLMSQNHELVVVSLFKIFNWKNN